jgi:hypothetical protein
MNGMDYVNVVLMNQRKEDGQSVFDVRKMNVFVASEKSQVTNTEGYARYVTSTI